MKTFLQTLLICFSLALCALMAFQWVREADLRREVQRLTDSVRNEQEKVRNLQAAISYDEAEIQRLDGLKKQFAQTLESNDVRIVSLTRNLERTAAELKRSESQIKAYKEALETANESIKRQNEDIKRQNEEMAKLAEERNEIVKKFNNMATDYSDLAAKWNKQQEELARAATNAPARQGARNPSIQSSTK
ncbi:MAG TPA: hypothetical protein VEC99_17955 [Clostridia bacterium]|nr:hypothetical protein [Clostridia bacterium]